jgi:pilus assembly protein CpaF
MIEIELMTPGAPPQVRRLGSGQYILGRSFGADVRLNHESVAKRHALLMVAGTELAISDLNANRGDDQAVRRLQAGDIYPLGHCQLRMLPSALAAGDARGAARDPMSEAPTIPVRLLESPAASIEAAPTLSAEALQPIQAKLQELVLRELDLFRRAALNSLSAADLRLEARHAIERIISSESIRVPDSVNRTRFIQEMTAEIMGYGPLEPFLADESVSEIMVNGPDSIYVERRGRLSRVPARFTSADSLMRVIERIVSPLGRRIDEGVPTVDARLPDGSRVNAIIPPLSLIGPILTVRKFSKQRFSMQGLVEIGSLTTEMAEFLRLCVHHRKNIVVSGGTGSGKTTFLNALSESIPQNERIVTIEDAAELRLAQPHIVSLEARPPNVEGRGEVTIRDLVRNTLRMRPDRIIVGECRGGEALDMLQAMNTGHDGSLTTGHANSPRDLLSRLEVMVLMAGMDLPVRAIREQISSAVDIVVQQTRFADGRRRVTSIIEVDGMEGDVILTQPLFAFKQKSVSPSGEIIGEYVGFGQAPRFYEELSEAGVRLDRSIFGQPMTADRRALV